MGWGVECNGDENGFINIDVAGGTGENTYSYNWSSGQTTEDLENIGAGEYTLIVTDQNLCSDSVTVTITEPELGLDLEGTISTYQGEFGVSCFGENDGSIDLTPIGGTTPYLYTWSNGETSQDISNLEAGEYSVVVTDANQCADSLTFVILSLIHI